MTPIPRSDHFQGSVAIWEEIFKLSAPIAGKQHLNLASTININISKNFPESTKALKKNVKAITTKVNGMVEELRKANAIHIKNCERYAKLVIDTENSIKNRSISSDVDVLEKEPVDSFMNRSINKVINQ